MTFDIRQWRVTDVTRYLAGVDVLQPILNAKLSSVIAPVDLRQGMAQTDLQRLLIYRFWAY